MVSRVFTFPNPVNHVAARLVAAGVVVMSTIAIAARQPWISVVIAYGFLARTSAGPRFSPLGRIAVALAPRVSRPQLVPGPPKRFAQSIGALFSLTAMSLWLSGLTLGTYIVLAVLLIPAVLEAVLGYCLGCEIFALAMRAGLIPESVCLECGDISQRHRHNQLRSS